MNERLARRLRRGFVPLAVGYAILWGVWWGYEVIVVGGLEPGQVRTLAMSGVTAGLLLLVAWTFRRVDRGDPE